MNITDYRFIQDYHNGDIDLAEVREYIFEKLNRNPFLVEQFYREKLISYEEARPYALKGLDPIVAFTLFQAGLVTREEARPFIFNELEVTADLFDVYIKHGLITPEEAKPYVVDELNSIPEHIEMLLIAGFLL